jgi:hypothetical protein
VGIAGLSHLRQRLASITIAFDEALNAVSAQGNHYALFLGVKRRRHVLFSKPIGIGSVSYDGDTHTATIGLAKPVKGPVQVVVYGGIVGANGVISNEDFSGVVG